MNAKEVTLLNLSKVYPGKAGRQKDIHAVSQLSLTVRAGEFVTLLGPSGCGKTTTLRMIAGFEKPTGGDILLNDRSVKNLTPDRRDTAMVFQNYALFPNLNVYDNISYGLKIKRLPAEEIHDKVMKILRLTSLDGLERRHTNELSGGQQQRVALARAIVTEPGVLLFDEPLSNLDAKLRVQMRTEIRKIQRAVGITALYVTHDQAEAMSMSDRIVIMKEGKIVQTGTPKEVYYHPVSEFCANFIGTANILHATIKSVRPDGSISVELLGGVLHGIPCGEKRYKIGDSCTLVIRPEACSLQMNGTFEAEVTLSSFMGAYQLYELDLQGHLFTVHENNPKNKKIYQVGEKARLALDISDLHAI